MFQSFSGESMVYRSIARSRT